MARDIARSELPYPWEAGTLLGRLPGPRECYGDVFLARTHLLHSGSVCFLTLSPDLRKLLSRNRRQPGSFSFHSCDSAGLELHQGLSHSDFYSIVCPFHPWGSHNEGFSLLFPLDGL